MSHVTYIAAAAAKSLQSYLTLCDPPGSAVPGILQARTLEWVAISFSNTWKWKVKVTVKDTLSRVRLLATPWTAAYQAPPSMGFSRQEYWSGLWLPSPVIYITECLTLMFIKQLSNFIKWFDYLFPLLFNHKKHHRMHSLKGFSSNTMKFLSCFLKLNVALQNHEAQKCVLSF